MRPYLQRLTKRQNLTGEEARAAMDYAVSGDAHDAEVGALISLLSAKGETAEEIAGIATSFRTHMVPVVVDSDVLDIVGTGGDGANTMNISTASSVLAAAAGCKVAKHGSRAVGSKCGSADVLEALGSELSLSADGVAECINRAGIGFMYASNHHPAFRIVNPVVVAMQIRNVFNILGPLLNPCEAKYFVLGVYDPALLDMMADALIASGVKRAMVVHTDGLDELSNTGVAELVEIHGKGKTRMTLDPQVELGMPRADVEDLRGGEPAENASIVLKVLSGQLEGPITDAIVLNAGVGCYIYGLDPTIQEGVQRAREVLKSGKALETLEMWVDLSQKAEKL